MPGLLVSAYFASVYHNIAPRAQRFVPEFCRIEPHTCATLLGTRYARVFKVPNFDLGILYYVGLGASSPFPHVWAQLHSLLWGGSIVALATGVYLSYALLFKLRVPCSLCFAAHGINLLIVLIFTVPL